ncbi:MAG TPA: 50S ribosomal protein L9 [Verrucomicrobiota bacterium]|nr:50S ribosomal protein L9 [Verrucomicrobiota bacterium]
MPKTEVILIKNVVGLGAESDHVSVTAGYARNYLIPGGLAVPVTRGNRKWIENLKKRRSERETNELNSMTELAKSLNKVTLTLLVKTGEDGKMFGSITSGSIADALKTQLDVALDKRKIHLEKPIHVLGEHDVELRLHPDVRCNLKVVIKSTTPLPEGVTGTAAPAEPKAEAPKTEKRGKRPAPTAAEAPAAPAKGAKGPRPAKHSGQKPK